MTSELSVGLDEGKHLVQRSHGYAIAEFALAIPALLIVVAMSVSLVGLTVTQIQLESAAALGARIVGRGDPIPDSFRNSLPEGTEMCMPGDNITISVELIQPIAMEKGLRFAIREGGRTVGAGQVTEVTK